MTALATMAGPAAPLTVPPATGANPTPAPAIGVTRAETIPVVETRVVETLAGIGRRLVAGREAGPQAKA